MGGVDIHIEREHCFIISCELGYKEQAEWLYSLGGVDVNIDNDFAFRITCHNGFIYLAKWLYDIIDYDIHKNDEYIFKLVCQMNYLNFAKWIYSLGDVNVRINNDLIFINMCELKHIKITRWLCTICDKYKISISYNKINPIIVDSIKFYLENKEWDKILDNYKCAIVSSNHSIDDCNIGDCNICYNNSNFVSNCKHNYCIECITKWIGEKNNTEIKCPYCQQDLILNQCTYYKND